MYRFFQRAAESLKPPPAEEPIWQARTIKNCDAYTQHIAPLGGVKGKDLDMRLHRPLLTNVFTCLDMRAPISEFVIAKHSNQLKKKAPELSGMVSIILAARTGVVQKFLANSLTMNVYGNIFYNVHSDARPRLGLTVSCRDVEGKGQMSRMIKFIDSIAPLSTEIKEQIAYLMDPNNVEGLPAHNFLPDDKTKHVYRRYKGCTLKWGGAVFVRYDTKHDMTLAQQLPEIHEAIITLDAERIASLLAIDPHCVFQRDPWGIIAHELGHHILSKEMFKLIYKAMDKLTLTYPEDKDTVLQYAGICQSLPFPDEDASFQYAGFYFRCGKVMSDEDKITERKQWLANQRKRVSDYLDLYDDEPDKRNNLHHACVIGDETAVIDTIKKEPRLIESRDPRGFTPLLLASANGHLDLVRWLIDKGASLDNVEKEMLIGDNRTYRLYDHAGSPPVMELILHKGVDVHAYNMTLTEVIMRNDVGMAKVMFYYLNHLPTDNGLSVLDIILRHCGQHGTGMLEVFLSYWDEYVPDGPYDVELMDYIRDKLGEDQSVSHEQSPYHYNLHPDAVQLLETHQKRIAKKREAHANRPKLIRETSVPLDNIIKTTLCCQGMTIESEIIPVTNLTKADREQVQAIFTNTFKMANDDSEDKRDEFLDKTLENNPSKQVFINLFKHKDNVVSFMVFEIEKSSHPEKGDFILFHGKLAAKNSNPSYRALSLSNLGFRVPLALKRLHGDMPVMVYFTAIPPGYGISILPKFIRFFPKFVMSQSFMHHVTALVDEKLGVKSIPLLLELQASRRPNYTIFALDYFDHMIGAESQNAMPVCYEMDARACREYMEEFADNNIDGASIIRFTEAWRSLDQLDALPLSSNNAEQRYRGLL